MLHSIIPAASAHFRALSVFVYFAVERVHQMPTSLVTDSKKL